MKWKTLSQPASSQRPKSKEIKARSQFLHREINLVNPRLLAPLGYFAVRHILEKYGLPLPPRHEFKKVYGKVVEAGGKHILPLQHPSAVPHDSRISSILVANYRKLGDISTHASLLSG